MNVYRHRPAPTGLHAKLIDELSAASCYEILGADTGRPNHITVYDGPTLVWYGHRDLLPSAYREAQDPYLLLKRPASD